MDALASAINTDCFDRETYQSPRKHRDDVSFGNVIRSEGAVIFDDYAAMRSDCTPAGLEG
jgi:hypothetical protein